jgi:hypothetical protein
MTSFGNTQSYFIIASELSQFALVEEMSLKSIQALSSFFCTDKDIPLTADIVRKLFIIIRYSVEGSNERQKENRAYMYFIDYLDDCEDVSNQLNDKNKDNDLSDGMLCIVC